MNNKILTSNHILHSLSAHDAVKKLKQAGYDGVELWMDDFVSQKEKGMASLSLLKRAFDETGMISTIHSPIRDEKGNKLNLSSKDNSLRSKSVRALIDSIKIAGSLKSELINIHPGQTDSNSYDKEYDELNMDSVARICDEASKRGILVSMEIMEERPKEFIKEPRQIIDIINRLEKKNLGITLDIVPAYTHGIDNVQRYLKEIRTDISYVFHCHVSGHTKNITHVPFAFCEIKDFWKIEIKEFLKFYQKAISIEGSLMGKPIDTAMTEEDVVKDNLSFIRGLVDS